MRKTDTTRARPAWRNPAHVLAFGFGAGAIPVAPGTFGTLVGVPIYLLLHLLPVWMYVGVVVAMLGAGVWLCGRVARDLGVHDHPGIVWDEIVGFQIAMFLAPVGWLWLAVGFALFRLFDIVKPWPIGWMDRNLAGGWGIMLDDVLAGVYAAIVLQVLRFW